MKNSKDARETRTKNVRIKRLPRSVRVLSENINVLDHKITGIDVGVGEESRIPEHRLRAHNGVRTCGRKSELNVIKLNKSNR